MVCFTEITRVQGHKKFLNTLQPMEEIVFELFPVCGAIMVEEIIHFAWNLSDMFVYCAKLVAYFLVYIAQIEGLRGYRNALGFMQEKILKSVLILILCIKFNQINARDSDAYLYRIY